LAFWIGQTKMYDASATDGKVCKGYKGVGTDGQYIYYTPYHNGNSYHGVVLRQKIYAIFSNSDTWEAYDVGSTDGLNCIGFTGNPIFDGHFMYFTPSNNGATSGVVLRYDTTKPFKGGIGWEIFELTDLGNNNIALKACNGQYVCAETAGADPLTANRSSVGLWETFELTDLGSNNIALKACNGKYVCAESEGASYLIANRDAVGAWETFQRVNLGSNKIALKAVNGNYVCVSRSDSKLYSTIGSVASWEAYDAGYVDSLTTKGFSGAVYDGRFIYFVPYNNGAYNGIILRYDTTKPFKAAGSWEAYDFGSLAGGAAKGYSGGEIVDGFLYLSPFQNTSAKHGKIVRYALSKPFKVAGSWEVFDATAVAADAKALGQPCTDGRFVYFPNAYYEIVLRYDTQKPFGQAASYDYFNLSTLCWNVAAHNACCKQGTHIVFAPDESNLLAYDTEKPFADSGSWADREVLYAKDMHTFGFRGCYSDPNYIYFAPWAYHGSVYHGSVARMRVDPCPGQSLPLPGSSEDLSKYMYYESGVASVSSSRATGYYDDASVWGLVFQDYEKDFFDGFVIQFDFKLVSAYLSDAVESIPTELGLFSLSNAHYPWDEVYSLPAGADDPVVVISVYWNEDGELDSAELNLVEGNWYSYSSTLNISVGTVYYCTISRSDGSSTVTLKVYSNAARTTLLKTMTVTSFTASRKWRFIYALRGMSDADGMASATVWVENLKIVSY